MKKKFVVIEDMESWSEMYNELLKDNYSITAVSSFQEAIKFLDKFIFDLVILDIRLDINNNDNVDGLMLLNKIRKKQGDVSIVVVSGYPEVLKYRYYKDRKPDVQFKKSTINISLLKKEIDKLSNKQTENEKL